MLQFLHSTHFPIQNAFIIARNSHSLRNPLYNKKIERILIANRGEIALRILRTARRLGIDVAAVYSDEDINAQHVKLADSAWRLGPAPALQAIHPGYGFLSENSDFAEQCAKAGIKFIGPSAESIRAMGQKNRAKQIMIDAKVSVLLGYNGTDQDDTTLLEEAKKIGFPVMIKPVYGGGGKGMRIATSIDNFAEALEAARSESNKSFGNSEMILEKYIEDPRHAVDAARAVDYEGAGTVEFIMDKTTGHFYFMEMNTRLQVEHPITESITGVDLVEWQIRVAQGEKIPLKQQQIPLNGHSIEARLYAEDLDKETRRFMPAAGKLEYLRFPSSDLTTQGPTGLRIDSGVIEGDSVSVHYDPMLAKVVAWGTTREDAIRRLDLAIKSSQIGGIATNLSLIRACLNHPQFQLEDGVTTHFIEQNMDELLNKLERSDTINFDTDDAFTNVAINERLLCEYFLEVYQMFFLPIFKCFDQKTINSFRINHFARRLFPISNKKTAELVILGDNTFIVRSTDSSLASNLNQASLVERRLGSKNNSLPELKVHKVKRYTSENSKLPVIEFSYSFNENQKTVKAIFGSQTTFLIPLKSKPQISGSGADLVDSTEFEARSPIPGVVEKILVNVGESVKKGQSLATMSAMKMEFVIRAPADRQIKKINCQVGQTVGKNSLLIEYENPQ